MKYLENCFGEKPAINCFDFIHLPFSQPGGWIDYSNIKVVEDWHKAGGIVTIIWHWNVPANNGSDWSFYYGSEADKTKFDVRKIMDENSAEIQTPTLDNENQISASDSKKGIEFCIKHNFCELMAGNFSPSKLAWLRSHSFVICLPSTNNRWPLVLIRDVSPFNDVM